MTWHSLALSELSDCRLKRLNLTALNGLCFVCLCFIIYGHYYIIITHYWLTWQSPINRLQTLLQHHRLQLSKTTTCNKAPHISSSFIVIFSILYCVDFFYVHSYNIITLKFPIYLGDYGYE